MTVADKVRAKTMTVEEALSKIPDGALIGIIGGALSPKKTQEKLHTIADRLTRAATVYGGGGNYQYLYGEQYGDKFNIWTCFYGKSDRELHPTGRVSLIPLHQHQNYTRLVEVWQPDVVIFAGRAVDRHGYVRNSFGTSAPLFAECAKLVIAEVTPYCPIIYGENFVHIDDIDCLIETDARPDTFEPVPLTDEDRAIGAYVADLVEDGSTIQLGIGAAPDAVAKAFMGKRDLGIHTEMITTSMAELALAGVVTGKRKSLHKGKIVGTFADGNQMLYDFLEENPSIYMMPNHYLNNPYIIAQNNKMVSINTCIEVDLVGQAASETMGVRQYSGTGGQNDTAEGAIHAPGGKSIIAMRSSVVKRDGSRISKIKPMLTAGAVVTLSRNNIDYYVTEYGVAPMKARTIRQRVDNLIAVAHPDFRAELREQANKLMLW